MEKSWLYRVSGNWDDKELQSKVLEYLTKIKDENVRNKMSETGRKFVDGAGALKIVNHCISTYAKEVELRPAEITDIHEIFELSNEDEVRQNSFKTDKITFQEHEKWLKNKLEDENIIFLVAEIDNRFAGQVRFGLEENEAIISISIAKEFRDFGLGSKVIKTSLEYVKENYPQIEIIKAHIKESNKKSIGLFEKMNFKKKEISWMKNQNAILYIYRYGDLDEFYDWK